MMLVCTYNITQHEFVFTPSLSYLGHLLTNSVTYIISVECMTYSYVCRIFTRYLCNNMQKGTKGITHKNSMYVFGSNFPRVYSDT